MRKKYILIGLVGVVVGVLLVSVVVVLAGNMDSPEAPAHAAAQMYTLEQIYDRLDTGAEATKMTQFTEPSSGPGSSMHTMDEIMARAPAADNTDGATKTEVANGKKYWSLRTDGSGGSSWGLETGQLYGGCTCCSTCTLHANRWCDNGDGTVTDLTTCLVWLQKADWGGRKVWRCKSGHALCSDEWDDAHTRAGILKAGTADANLSDGSVEGDWRLPTKTELVGLVNGTPPLRCGPWPGLSLSCDLYAFTGVQSHFYWSSTTEADFPGFAWVVDLVDGPVFSDVKDYDFYVWPVRGGQ